MSKIHDFLVENVYAPVDAWTAGSLAHGMQQTTGSFLKSEYQLSELKKIDFFGEDFRRSTAFAPIEAVVAVAVAVLAFSPSTLIASCDSESGKGNADEATSAVNGQQATEIKKLESPCDEDGNGLIDDDQIPDPALRETIKTYLGLGPEEMITLVQANQMGTLYDYPSVTIIDLEGIQCLPNLHTIEMGWSQISDLGPLQELVNLVDIRISNCQINDLSPLRGLVNLSKLYLSFNQISDLSPLEGLASLSDLDLSSNQISDPGPLQGLVNLEILGLVDNQISDISALLLNPGLSAGDVVYIKGNPAFPNGQVDQLCAKGVEVYGDWVNGWCNSDDGSDD